MRNLELSKADLLILEGQTFNLSSRAIADITAALDEWEGRNMIVPFNDDDAEYVDSLIGGPAARPRGGYTNWVIALLIAGSLIIGSAGSGVLASETGFTNDCRGWAVALHKEGRVRDSAIMHMLGCDDGAYANAHYHADAGSCEYRARRIARTGLYNRPRTVAAMVEAQLGCIVFEDGSYADPI